MHLMLVEFKGVPLLILTAETSSDDDDKGRMSWDDYYYENDGRGNEY